MPANYAAWLWGWPEGFMDRMKRVRRQVFVVGRYVGGEGSSGIDRAEDLQALAHGPSAGIWTNRIDRIAPLVRAVKPIAVSRAFATTIGGGARA